MKYIKAYAPEWDMVFQHEVSDETAAKIDVEVSDVPFQGVKILPRNKSDWDYSLIEEEIASFREGKSA
jgi:hypothetical protein